MSPSSGEDLEWANIASSKQILYFFFNFQMKWINIIIDLIILRAFKIFRCVAMMTQKEDQHGLDILWSTSGFWFSELRTTSVLRVGADHLVPSSGTPAALPWSIRSSSANQERGLAMIWTEADETRKPLFLYFLPMRDPPKKWIIGSALCVQSERTARGLPRYKLVQISSFRVV